MKINEILREFGADQVDVGKDVGQDWKKGTDFVKNLTDPKRWFGGSSDTSNARVKRQLSNDEVKKTLTNVSAGSINQNDIGSIKQIINNLKNGTFRSADNRKLIEALTAVMNGQQLNPNQEALVKQFAQTF